MKEIAKDYFANFLAFMQEDLVNFLTRFREHEIRRITEQKRMQVRMTISAVMIYE